MKLPWNREQSELDREVAYHIETLADAYEAEGMTRAEARARARKEFGGVEQVKELCRQESRWHWLVQFRQDLRFGWRMMRRSPATSAAAVLSLALGIGATTAIFSVADAVLWRKLPVPQAEQLLEVYWTTKRGAAEGLLRSSSGSNFREDGLRVADFFSQAGFDSIRQRTAGKLEVAAHVYAEEASVSYDGRVMVARVRPVSEEFFPLLRVRPHMGRLLDRNSVAPEVVVSHAFWDRQLGGSDKAIGTTLRINNRAYNIAGVLPRGFHGLSAHMDTPIYSLIRESPAVLAPDSWIRERMNDPLVWWMQLVARRAGGVTVEEASALMQSGFESSWQARPKNEAETPRIRLLDASTGLGGIRAIWGAPCGFCSGWCRWCWWWRARTSPICCWRGPWNVKRKWRCGWRSAAGAAG